jgi:hypothetical protein
MLGKLFYGMLYLIRLINQFIIYVKNQLNKNLNAKLDI